MLGIKLFLSILPLIALANAQGWRFSRPFTRFPPRYVPRPAYVPPRPVQTVPPSLPSVNSISSSTPRIVVNPQSRPVEILPTTRSPLIPALPQRPPAFFRPRPFLPSRPQFTISPTLRPSRITVVPVTNSVPNTPKPDLAIIYPESYKPTSEISLARESELIAPSSTASSAANEQRLESVEQPAIVSISPAPSSQNAIQTATEPASVSQPQINAEPSEQTSNPTSERQPEIIQPIVTPSVQPPTPIQPIVQPSVQPPTPIQSIVPPSVQPPKPIEPFVQPSVQPPPASPQPEEQQLEISEPVEQPLKVEEIPRPEEQPPPQPMQDIPQEQIIPPLEPETPKPQPENVQNYSPQPSNALLNVPPSYSVQPWPQPTNPSRIPNHPYPWMPTTAKPISIPSRITILAEPVYQPVATSSRPVFKMPNDFGQVSVLMDYQCAQPNGYYSVPNQCDSFIECKGNRAMQIICPDGLHFNPNAAWPEYPCDFPAQVRCAANLAGQAPKPTANCPRQYGYFPSISGDCGKYVMCQEGIATEMSCPSGLAFNYEQSICDWPSNVPSCNPNVFKGFTCPIPDVIKDGKPSDFIYKYRQGKSCRNYIACQRGSPRLLSCDHGLSFDELSQSCVDSDLVTDCI